MSEIPRRGAQPTPYDIVREARRLEVLRQAKREREARESNVRFLPGPSDDRGPKAAA